MGKLTQIRPAQSSNKDAASFWSHLPTLDPRHVEHRCDFIQRVLLTTLAYGGVGLVVIMVLVPFPLILQIAWCLVFLAAGGAGWVYLREAAPRMASARTLSHLTEWARDCEAVSRWLSEIRETRPVAEQDLVYLGNAIAAAQLAVSGNTQSQELENHKRSLDEVLEV